MTRKPTVLAAIAAAALTIVFSALGAQIGSPAPDFHGSDSNGKAQSQVNDPNIAEEQAAERQALGFLGYLDQMRYADSYAYTGMLIRAQVDREKFASQIKNARTGTGALQGRELIDAAYTTTVAGAPEGRYVVLHYHASFANRPDVVETVTLAFANGYWRVDGYYIK